jgi:hypothetical protein
MLKLNQGALLLAVFVFLGCGPGGPPSGQLSGSVTYKGEPLSTGTIVFMPQSADIPYAQAEIAEDGTYTAMTKEFGKRIPVGNYRVMISAVKDMGPEAPVVPLIPFKYSSDTQSGLTAQVSEGENKVDFDLDS